MLLLNCIRHTHPAADAAATLLYTCVLVLTLQTYLAAGKRCGLSETAAGYWVLHITEDERHGRQMLEEVALPLVDM
jgi:hypothetical protein